MEIAEQREAFSRESRKCWTVNHPFRTGLGHRRIDDRTCHHKNPPTVSLPWQLHEERNGWKETPTQWPYYSALTKMFHLLFKASWWELEKLQSGQTKIFQWWQGDKPGRCTWILHVLVNTAKENAHARRTNKDVTCSWRQLATSSERPPFPPGLPEGLRSQIPTEVRSTPG